MYLLISLQYFVLFWNRIEQFVAANFGQKTGIHIFVNITINSDLIEQYCCNRGNGNEMVSLVIFLDKKIFQSIFTPIKPSKMIKIEKKISFRFPWILPFCFLLHWCPTRIPHMVLACFSVPHSSFIIKFIVLKDF